MKLFRTCKQRITCVILLGLVLSALTVQADELIGKVISIDRESRQLVVAPIADGQQDGQKAVQVTAVLPEYMIFQRPSGRRFPGWAEVGTIIGVVGQYTDDRRQLFFVVRVHPDYSGPGHDPTGVRSRIGRGCKQQSPGFRGRQKERSQEQKKRKNRSVR